MPKLRKGEEWARGLRADLKGAVGLGWNVCGHESSEGRQTGKTKLTYRRDGQRSSVMLPFSWEAASKVSILARVQAIAAYLYDHPQESLADAAARNADVEQEEASPSAPGLSVKGWEAVRARFLKSKATLRSKTLRDWSTRTARVLEVLVARPKPRSGDQVLEAYAKRFFLGPKGEQHAPQAQMPAGSLGRRRNLKDAIAFLNFATSKCGMPLQYRPTGDELENLVGTPATDVADRKTPALKPDQVAMLLDGLLEEGKPRLYLAVGLVAYLGLRPSELATLRVVDGEATVVSTKRNHRDMRKGPKTRSVFPLEIAGRNGEGAQLLQLFEHGGKLQLPSGEVYEFPRNGLPRQIQHQINRVSDKKHERATDSFTAVGSAFNQMLTRDSKAWRQLMDGPSATGVSPYSLRHGFSWRASYGPERMPLRVAAALMGHDLQTHLAWYGSWISKEDLEDAVKGFNEKVAA